MLKKIIKTFFGLFWGKKLFQPIFERLFFFSLKGMNVGGGSFFNESGEAFVLGWAAKKIFKPGAKVLLFDVGANTGHYSLMAEKMCKEAGLVPEIFAFEPSAKTFERLRQNTKNHDSIHQIQIGLGQQEAKAKLYSDEESSGMASLYKRDMSYFKIDFNLEEEVNILTLDRFCEQQNISHIDFLKLDVEGNEMQVLLGGSKMFERGAIDLVQFEFGGADIDARVFLRDYVNFFKKDFVIYRILKDGLRNFVYSEHHEIFVTTNFLAVKNSILKKL